MVKQYQSPAASVRDEECYGSQMHIREDDNPCRLEDCNMEKLICDVSTFVSDCREHNSAILWSILGGADDDGLPEQKRTFSEEGKRIMTLLS